MPEPLVTVAVPSLNQGAFLDKALSSIFEQQVPVEVFVLDAGSTDNSLNIIQKWADKLAWWRSEPDAGQSAAINEGIAKGSAPYVCWLNADDYFLPNGLNCLVESLENTPAAPAVYGRCWTVRPNGSKVGRYITAPFWPWLLANYCFICQPGTLIRRNAWESLGGLDENLHMAMDYDLWWRLFQKGGKLNYVKQFVAATTMHGETKTASQREAHYREAIEVVKKYTGRTPLKWRIAWPLMVSLRHTLNKKFR
jgi:GT2 family glycosyltransferase